MDTGKNERKSGNCDGNENGRIAVIIKRKKGNFPTFRKYFVIVFFDVVSGTGADGLCIIKTFKMNLIKALLRRGVVDRQFN